jgi:hypothetical protein
VDEEPASRSTVGTAAWAAGWIWREEEIALRQFESWE